MNAASIRVESSGLLTTVQDLGRPGYAHLGVSSAGAADSLAFRIGNLLAGNDENAPALEMTITGGTFTFTADAVVAITGGECGDAPAWKPFRVDAGNALRLGRIRSGARMYLSVRGGFAVPRVLGSVSTHVPSRIGGVEGRALRRGDFVEIGTAAVREPVWSGLNWRPVQDGLLRATAGPQHDWFGGEFYRDAFTVREDSNRMGVRLAGSPVRAIRSEEMLTEGVTLGTVQVPAGGEPIILFVDHQTTGGYPKIANVISADMWKVGQLRPRDCVRFRLVSIERALEALRLEESRIRSLCESI